MGYPMAANVRKKIPSDSTLFINDIDRSACEKFQAEYSSFGKVEILDTAREVANDAEVLFSIVPSAVDVRKVYLDSENGVVAAKRSEERIMFECSTIDVRSTREVGQTLQQQGCGTYIDAPVSVRTYRSEHHRESH